MLKALLRTPTPSSNATSYNVKRSSTYGGPYTLLANLATTNYTDGGLANSSGLVGRRLMVHPSAFVHGLFEDPLQSWSGRNGSVAIFMRFIIRWKTQMSPA